MNLRQRYRFKGKRRLARFLLLYSFLAFFFLFYSTFARYATVVEDAPTIEIANWEIKVNDMEAGEGQTVSNIITLVPDVATQTTTNNKLAPGQNGYFDIIINPAGTEVSVEYIINLETTNLPTGLTLTTYEVQEDSISETLANNTITGEITLSETSQGLDATDIKTVRIYWAWEENSNISIPTGEENYSITATITLKQIL